MRLLHLNPSKDDDPLTGELHHVELRDRSLLYGEEVATLR